eukprot:TRINITY_DN312_c0_g1_i2.p1 TRINITY_DN312_c0_g1~~TRINITY_DN312_c0_g1_i2.p1  ORF type:complete len:715 (-),score=153.76 TRINITY_DN312_c0_g1_i2:585-2669(-)
MEILGSTINGYQKLRLSLDVKHNLLFSSLKSDGQNNVLRFSIDTTKKTLVNMKFSDSGTFVMFAFTDSIYYCSTNAIRSTVRALETGHKDSNLELTELFVCKSSDNKEIISPQWHPCTDITDVECAIAFILHDISINLSEFILCSVKSSKPIVVDLKAADCKARSFCIGPQRSGWYSYSVFIAFENKKIGVICPIYPENAVLEKDDEYLWKQARSESLIQWRDEPQKRHEFNYTLQFLNIGSQKEDYGVNKNKKNEGVAGEISCLECFSFVESKFERNFDDSGRSMKDRRLVMARGYESGWVEILLIFGPSWPMTRRSSVDTPTMISQNECLIYDTLNVSMSPLSAAVFDPATISSTSLSTSSTTSTSHVKISSNLIKDPLEPARLYFVCSEGVHAISIRGLETAFSNPNPSNRPIGVSVSKITDTVRDICSADIISESVLGYYMVFSLRKIRNPKEDEAFFTVQLVARTMEVATNKDELNRLVAMTAGLEVSKAPLSSTHSFSEVCAEHVSHMLPPRARQLEGSDDLDFAQQMTRFTCGISEAINHSKTLHTECEKRRNLLNKSLEYCQNQHNQITDTIHSSNQKNTSLLNKLHETQGNFKVISERIEEARYRLRLFLSQLTNSEREYHLWLQQNKASLPKFTNDVEMIRRKSNMPLSEQEPSSKTKQKIQYSQRLLQEATRGVKKMKAELDV